jgi:hypothetical protein
VDTRHTTKADCDVCNVSFKLHALALTAQVASKCDWSVDEIAHSIASTNNLAAYFFVNKVLRVMRFQLSFSCLSILLMFHCVAC